MYIWTEKFISWNVYMVMSYLLRWILYPMGFKPWKTDRKIVWTASETMFKNKPHLIKFHVSILFSRPSCYIYIYIYWRGSKLLCKLVLLKMICCILAIDPAKNAIPRWCTGRRWHILMAVMRGNRVGGNWLMKWDEVKNVYGTLIDWCTGREDRVGDWVGV